MTKEKTNKEKKKNEYKNAQKLFDDYMVRIPLILKLASKTH